MRAALLVAGGADERVIGPETCERGRERVIKFHRPSTRRASAVALLNMTWPASAECPQPTALRVRRGLPHRNNVRLPQYRRQLNRPLAARFVITTSPEHGFMHHTFSPFTSASPPHLLSHSMAIDIDPSSTAQEIVGFGAAITDAVAYCLTSLLDPAVGANLLKAAFIYAGLSMARVPMGAADFSRMNYALLVRARHLRQGWVDTRRREATTTSSTSSSQSANQPAAHRVLVSAWSAPPSYKHQNFRARWIGM